MNDITSTDTATEAAECAARHLSICREMVETALHLSRLAAQKVAVELTTPDVQPADSPVAHRRKAPDPVLAFGRLTRILQQAMALETLQIAGPKPAKSTTTRRETARSDPRRAPLRRGLHIATESQPDRTALRRQIDQSLDEKLSEDPGHEQAVYNLFTAICEEAGIKPDLGKIPDECLGFNIPSPAHETEPDTPEFDVHSDDFISYLRTGHPVPEHILRNQAKRAPET